MKNKKIFKAIGILFIIFFSIVFLKLLYSYVLIKSWTTYSDDGYYLVRAEVLWVYDDRIKDTGNYYKGMIKMTDFIGYVVVNYPSGEEDSFYVRENTVFTKYRPIGPTGHPSKYISGDIFNLKTGDVVDIWVSDGCDYEGTFEFAKEITLHLKEGEY